MSALRIGRVGILNTCTVLLNEYHGSVCRSSTTYTQAPAGEDLQPLLVHSQFEMTLEASSCWEWKIPWGSTNDSTEEKSLDEEESPCRIEIHAWTASSSALFNQYEEVKWSS